MLIILAVVLTVVVLAVWYCVEVIIALASGLIAMLMNFMTLGASFRSMPMTFENIFRMFMYILIMVLPRAIFAGAIVAIWWQCI